jgi:hypothetical protein
MRFTLSEANLCGLSTLGTVTLDASGATTRLAVSTTGEDIDATIRCITGQEVSLSGTYSMSSRVTGKGTGEELVRSLRGPVELTAKNGRIYQMTLLSRILTFLDVSELVQGNFPDLRKEGFPYRTLTLRGELKDGKLLVEELSIDAPSMGIAVTGSVNILGETEDLTVLVSPFRTADAIIRRIPIVRYLLGGTLVSIPVAVRGNVRDPSVTPMDPASVGRGLVGIVERTLKLPVHLISPIFPAKEKGKGDDTPY